MPDGFSRRSFLKLAAATGAGIAVPGCQPEVRKLIPYVVPDENVIPGVASWYATRCNECGAGCGILAKVREGRVIKLEGNPKDPISAGSICARGQASLQGLYNPDRLRTPSRRGTGGKLFSFSWEAALVELKQKLTAAAAKGTNRIAIISGLGGPTLDAVTDGWLKSWSSSRRVVLQPLASDAQIRALQTSFGRQEQPIYRIDAGEMLISFGADFIETWNSPLEQIRQYSAFRQARYREENRKAGHAVYIGPRFSLSAANCDEWIPTRPGAMGLVALAMVHEIIAAGLARGGVGLITDWIKPYDAAAVAKRTGLDADRIQKIAIEFAKSDGALAIADSDDELTNIATFALNSVTGNVGRTILFAEGSSPSRGAGTADLQALTTAMANGEIDLLLISGANPAFTAPPQFHFADAAKRVNTIVWAGIVPDESAGLAHLLLPINHSLETWGDSKPRAGIRGLQQPVMQPVFNTRPLGDLLIALTAEAANPKWRDIAGAVKASREQNAKGKSAEMEWQDALHNGGSYEQPVSSPAAFREQAFADLAEGQDQPSGLKLFTYPHVFLGGGDGADKSWLQEIPEPVTQLVWDSWAEIHPATARSLGVADNEMLELRTAEGSIFAAAHLTENVSPDVVAVPLGQGHQALGRYARDRGTNPWSVLPIGMRWSALEIRSTGEKRRLVSPQGLSERRDRQIAEAMSVSMVRAGKQPSEESEKPDQPYEFYDPYAYPEHHWGMTIDLDSCVGCSACVAACYAENNLPTVGREQVARGRIMSWIRIERFYPKQKDAPLLYITPMLCQQCGHAPCEPVCPVFAAYHTDEGLNGQVYNRCIGTRYCENNCPYKVRRFNFFKPDWPEPLNLQLNPDVTARGAGVMEKCTFCVQRIRDVEMDAEEDGRKVRDGEIVPACAQACPANAITFGDIMDPNSAMMRRRADNQPRDFRALEDLNTQPAIVYLRRVYREQEKA